MAAKYTHEAFVSSLRNIEENSNGFKTIAKFSMKSIHKVLQIICEISS